MSEKCDELRRRNNKMELNQDKLVQAMVVQVLYFVLFFVALCAVA